MPITRPNERVQTMMKMIVRSVVNRGGMEEITLSPATTSDPDLDTHLDIDDRSRDNAEYASKTVGVSPLVIRTSEPNRWVVGEQMVVKIKPVF